MPVTNKSHLDQLFFIEQPLKVTPLNDNYTSIEFNNHQIINKYSDENLNKIDTLIRIDHLNSEEKQNL